MTYGSLFAGIGGIDLGFDRAGLTCRWQVEIDPFCRKVLAKHWPDVRRHDDVRTWPQPDTEVVDVICGGFPCQDVSVAGRKVGLAGKRSGLWWEFARVVRILRPRFVVVENVPGILAPMRPGEQPPIGCVLGELSRIGYDAEWQTIPCSAVGAKHKRRRVFIIAYRDRHSGGPGRTRRANPLREVRETARAVTADIDRIRMQGTAQARQPHSRAQVDRCGRQFVGSGWWAAEPDVVRMVYGVPRRLVEGRIRGLGNAVVPQVAEVVGRALMRANSAPASPLP